MAENSDARPTGGISLEDQAKLQTLTVSSCPSCGRSLGSTSPDGKLYCRPCMAFVVNGKLQR